MNSTNRTSWMLIVTMLALIAWVAPTAASAKDAVSASVDGASVEYLAPSIYEPSLTAIMNNGNPLSQGTYAVGTIQLFFAVNATEFPIGDFASFSLDLAIKQGPTTGQQTQYTQFPGGIPLSLRQTGSENLTLSWNPLGFSVTDDSWSDSTTVTISIPDGVPNDDGTDLVANLQLEAARGSHLDTPTTVQVHILLVHPAACTSLHSFLTDNEFTTIVTDTLVNMGGPRNNPKVVSTSPFGQFSYNVLILNNCGTDQVFNLGITLDNHFETNPKNNPGNAVFTYLLGETVDPSEFDITDFGTGTGAGQNLWFSDITVPAGHSFLVTVHIQLIKGEALSWLPLTSTDPPPPAGIFSGFAAQLYTPSTTLSSLSTGSGIPAPLVEPSSDTATMDFTVK